MRTITGTNTILASALVSAVVVSVLSLAADNATTKNTTRPADAKPPEIKLKADAPEPIRAAWRNSEKSKLERVAALTKSLKAAEDLLYKIRRGQREFDTPEARREGEQRQVEMVSQLKADIDSFKSSPFVPPTISRPEDIRVGTVGYLYADRVSQVVDANNVIMEIRAIHFWDVHVGPNRQSSTVWVSGFPTEGLVDDQKYDKVVPLFIYGTKTYDTAIGSQRTVLLAEKFNPKKFLGP